MKRNAGVVVLLQLVLLTGCTSFTGVRPISPKAANPDSPEVVGTLQPTFQWEVYPDAEAYDFIIWNRVKGAAFAEGTDKPVYYREGLKETKHQIAEPLKPDTEYLWSVRVRRGTTVSNWSLYDYAVELGVYASASKQPFVFKTPKKAE